MILQRFCNCLCNILALLLLVGASAARSADGDAAVLAAYDAYTDANLTRLEAQGNAVRGHVLEPYYEYWRLLLRLAYADAPEVHTFLSRHAGSRIADDLRAQWLEVLGERRDWRRFDVDLAPLVLDKLEVRCYAWASRLAQGDRSVLDAAVRLWLEPIKLPAGCDRLAEDMAEIGSLTEDLAWRRARVQMEERRRAEAGRALEFVSRKDRPSAATLRLVARKPERVLGPLLKKKSMRKADRELAVLAMIRLAGISPQRAADVLEGRLTKVLAGADERYLWGRIAMEAARRHEPEALAWFERADRHALTHEQREWKARAALRAGHWVSLRDTIDEMSVEAHRDPAWAYWYGRALAALGRASGARAHFLRIAGEPDFYGLLATEELGDYAALPAEKFEASREDLARAERNPGLQRALALYRINLRTDANREWVFTIRTLNDGELLAAAELARRADIPDRTINTADRTQIRHNFELRYLAPYRDVFSAYAKEHELDEYWVLGLVRQESRFIADAKSWAGARGLMQLMPRTARWTARKIGMKKFKLRDVTDVETNVTLGTSYLKMVLDSLGHPVLASAGYNAGPGRARRWRDNKPLEGAIYVETIPFDETRDYVKKVMANAVFYALLDGQRPSLKAQLGTMEPKITDDVEKNDLP
ncbi:MAG TPA: transglycosylase SLT domain-containing protein [Burkholderiales bacterium]|nr:transglycosylase SLT domain-containing protein [Burkholderiales bacterium]